MHDTKPADTQPCGHPTTRIKRARYGAGWSYWCGECVKQALRATEDVAPKREQNPDA